MEQWKRFAFSNRGMEAYFRMDRLRNGFLLLPPAATFATEAPRGNCRPVSSDFFEGHSECPSAAFGWNLAARPCRPSFRAPVPKDRLDDASGVAGGV
jgi:hypothetical protein